VVAVEHNVGVFIHVKPIAENSFLRPCRFFYVTRKNPTTVQHKLAFRKYDPVVRRHVIFKEVRISRAKPPRRG